MWLTSMSHYQFGSVATTVDVSAQVVEVQTTTAAVERTVNGP